MESSRLLFIVHNFMEATHSPDRRNQQSVHSSFSPTGQGCLDLNSHLSCLRVTIYKRLQLKTLLLCIRWTREWRDTSIYELFPIGITCYILEIGKAFQWTRMSVEAPIHSGVPILVICFLLHFYLRSREFC